MIFWWSRLPIRAENKIIGSDGEAESNSADTDEAGEWEELERTAMLRAAFALWQSI